MRLRLLSLTSSLDKGLGRRGKCTPGVSWDTFRVCCTWEKGAPSGCRFSLVAAYVNCEQNSLLYLVRPFPEGARHGICHTRNARGEPRRGCFYRRIDLDTLELRNENP